MIRTRFAPSPTGPLHIGTIRTALFPFLFAQNNKGDFILRIEDTDKERSEKRWEDELIKGLDWLGIKWNEGPFRQSERGELYKEQLEKLIKDGHAYHCFCSKEEVEAQKQHLMGLGEAPVYRGKCRDLPKETVEKYLKEGKKSVIRFRTPVNQVISFNDIIRGKIDNNTNTMGDFVIAKDFDNFLFNFTCAVDDMLMEISHVIRGEDHIPNTPKQILIINALGAKEPKYAHLPLILGTDKKKMSKRTGKTSLNDYVAEGYLPEAVLNFIAFLGWNPGTTKEMYTMEELINDFSLEKIQKSAAIFNIDKLDWINGLYIREMSLMELTEKCLPYLPQMPIEELLKIVALYHERLKKLSEITELTNYFFKEKLDYDKELLRWKDMSDEEIKISLEKTYNTISEGGDVMELANKEDNRGNILWPLRVSLTGKKNSAGPLDIINVLGKEKVLKRIKEAIELIK
ncbi:MAG: glutamate--tRNA ligase [Candidatus Pacebacteria bacterium]|nr:glutamate--tRNA ligase [Candidatus Paceibacterota bacterium]MDD2757070.1 glutamate--tRNA ligase [Candidatus Paceibacterota bacterium]MDD3283690.1 glutamate--tRNA ligase [Candidatus Paceibacterota bacterium]MDD3969835.1 glutamate--tRNA ligase [Candidatus Paceibacterota bacterium]MDD4737753.1 glutamate--tRNA ligase [Candidatus Paceibacterota bacterium]